MKLNLGCGPKHLPGFVNVDLPGNWSGKEPDVAADVTQPLPFDDGSADEIHAYHVIEHLERFHVERVIDDWVRVLKPGGKLVLECPCLDKIIGHFRKAVETQKPLDPRLTIWGLFGDPNYEEPAMMHRWCYLLNELLAIVRQAGLEASHEAPQTHVAARDMRVVGIKPA